MFSGIGKSGLSCKFNILKKTLLLNLNIMYLTPFKSFNQMCLSLFSLILNTSIKTHLHFVVRCRISSQCVHIQRMCGIVEISIIYFNQLID